MIPKLGNVILLIVSVQESKSCTVCTNLLKDGRLLLVTIFTHLGFREPELSVVSESFNIE